ncbi:MAG: condensation domain-containing protein [Verrucomicrobiota bacterium]
MSSSSIHADLVGRLRTLGLEQRSELRHRLAGLSVAQRAALAQRLGRSPESAVAVDPIPKATPLRRGEHPTVSEYPASRSQQRMWFLYQLAPDSAVYSVPSAWRLRGPLSAQKLEAAYRAVVCRHEALRTTFALEDEGVVQRVHGGSVPAWEFRDLSPMPVHERPRAAEQILRRLANRGFDLETELPIRMLLLQLGPEEHLLMLQVHHIVFDGASRLVLLQDLSASYAGLAAGGDGGLPPLALQAADISGWQEQQLARGLLSRDESFWKSSLAGVMGGPELPRDFERPALSTFAGDTRVRDLDPALRERLQSVAGAEGATLFMTLLAAFAILLRCESGQTDLVICIPISGRTRTELEPVIGYFANTLPLRLRVSDGISFREFLAQVRSVVLDAHAHQEMPVERLMELLPGVREHAGASLLSVLFGVRERTDSVLQLPEVAVEEMEIRTATSRMDLYLAVEPTVTGWRAAAEYSTDLFKAPRVEGWLESWQRILERVAEDPGRRVADC